MNKFLLALGALTAFTACTKPVDDTGEDTGDTSAECEDYAGATEIGFTEDDCAADYGDYTAPEGNTALTQGCDAAGWYVQLYTVGWSNGADIEVTQTNSNNPWEESWTLPVVEDDDMGYWTYLERELTEVDTLDAVDDTHTFYKCDDADMRDGLTFYISVLDSTGAEADCAVWGHDTSFFSAECAETTW